MVRSFCFLPSQVISRFQKLSFKCNCMGISRYSVHMPLVHQYNLSGGDIFLNYFFHFTWRMMHFMFHLIYRENIWHGAYRLCSYFKACRYQKSQSCYQLFLVNSEVLTMHCHWNVNLDMVCWRRETKQCLIQSNVVHYYFPSSAFVLFSACCASMDVFRWFCLCCWFLSNAGCFDMHNACDLPKWKEYLIKMEFHDSWVRCNTWRGCIGQQLPHDMWNWSFLGYQAGPQRISLLMKVFQVSACRSRKSNPIYVVQATTK